MQQNDSDLLITQLPMTTTADKYILVLHEKVFRWEMIENKNEIYFHVFFKSSGHTYD